MPEHRQGLPIYQGEPPEPWRSFDVLERAKQTILSTLFMSSDHYRPLRQNFDEYFDRFTGQPLNLKQTNRIRSNVPSGLVSEMIDTFHADGMVKIYEKRPMVSARPMEASDIEIAQVRESLIQFQLDNATEHMGSWPIFDQIFLNALLFGSAPAKIAWVQRTRNVRLPGIPEGQPVIAYRGPVIVPAFIYDVYPHPSKVFPEDNYPLVHATFESYDDLLDLKDSGIYTDAVDEIPEGVKGMSAVLGAETANAVVGVFDDVYQRSDQRNRMGWTSDARLEQDGVLVLECECMFRPRVEYTDLSGEKRTGDEPVRSILTMANGVVIRVSPSPMPNGTSVWINAKINHLPGQFYGVSLVQKNKPQVHMAEVTLNMVLQNLGQSVNKMKVLRRDLLESATSLDDQPGGILFAKPGVNVNDVVREIQTSQIGADAFNMIRFAMDRAEGVSGATALKQGRISSGETTATESNIAFSQASQRFKYALEWFGASFILPMARKYDIMNQNFLDLPFVHRVVGKNNSVFFSNVTEQAMAIPVDYVFTGPSRDESEAMAIAQLQNGLKVVTPLIQFIPGMDVVIKGMVMELLDRFNIPGIEQIAKVLRPEEQLPLLEQQGGGQGNGLDQSINRQDRRLGSGGPPESEQGIVNSLGGLLANAQ